MPTLTTLIPTNLTTFDKTYQVRDNITVTIEQRHNHKGGGYDEARAVFSYPHDHDVVLMVGDMFQIARICGYPQPEDVVQQFDDNASFQPQKSGGGDFAQEAYWKEYKLRDSGWKTNLWVYDNAKLELEHKYGGKSEPWNKITLQIGDILAALALIKLSLDRTKLSTAATYAQLVDSLTQYGGTNNATTHDYQVPADGVFRVSREHYDPDAEPEEDINYSGDSDDQRNNVRIDVAFAVDWLRMKLRLADTEYDLEPAEPRWLDTETWVIMGDGFEESLCLCRFTEKHYPKEEVGVCFLAEWE